MRCEPTWAEVNSSNHVTPGRTSDLWGYEYGRSRSAEAYSLVRHDAASCEVGPSFLTWEKLGKTLRRQTPTGAGPRSRGVPVSPCGPTIRV